MPIGSQGAGEHVGITAVVFGAGNGESIAEAVELFGVDCIDLETALKQDLDDGTVRRLEDPTGCEVGREFTLSDKSEFTETNKVIDFRALI